MHMHACANSYILTQDVPVRERDSWMQTPMYVTKYLWDMNVHYDYVHQTYNGTYVEVHHYKQRNFGNNLHLCIEA